MSAMSTVYIQQRVWRVTRSHDLWHVLFTLKRTITKSTLHMVWRYCILVRTPSTYCTGCTCDFNNNMSHTHSLVRARWSLRQSCHTLFSLWSGVPSSYTLVCAYCTLFPNSSILSPNMETSTNNLILVGHGVHADIQHLEEMKISTCPSSPFFPPTSILCLIPKMTCTELPHNVLVIDTTALEHTLSSVPPQAQGQQSSKKHMPYPSLAALLCALSAQPACLLNNSGNNAFMGLYAFQWMIDPESAVLPIPAAVPMSTAAQVSSAHMGVPAVLVHPALSPHISGIPGIGSMGMGIGGMYAPAQYLPVNAHGVGTVHGAGLSPHMSTTCQIPPNTCVLRCSLICIVSYLNNHMQPTQRQLMADPTVIYRFNWSFASLTIAQGCFSRCVDSPNNTGESSSISSIEAICWLSPLCRVL